MKRALKIIGITLGSIIGTVVLVVGVAVYLIFTPERLTPIARQVADKYVTCDHGIGQVDLTFFSTFPYFGVSIKDVYLVNPKADAQSDTLLAVPELVASVELINAIYGNIAIQRFQLRDATANIFIAEDGTTNYDVFDITPSEEEEKTSGWQVRSLTWEEDLAVKAQHISFLDDRDTIRASLSDAVINLASFRKDKKEGARLDVQAQHICARIKEVQYADDLRLQLHLPTLFADDYKRVIIDGSSVQVNDFGLTLDGEIGTPDLSSGTYDMNVHVQSGRWPILPVLALVPDQFKQALADIDVDGVVQLDAYAQGVYSDSLLPAINAHVILKHGTGSYKPLPYELHDVAMDVEADLRLNKGERSSLVIRSLSANTKQTALALKGSADDLLGDMKMKMSVDIDANIPDFAYFFPEAMTLTGRAQAKADMRMRLSDLTSLQPERGTLKADITLTDIHYAMDSMVIDLPKTHASLQLPNTDPSKQTVNWLKMDLTTDRMDLSMPTPLMTTVQASTIQIETGNFLSDDPVVYAAAALQTDYPLAVMMDSMELTVNAPQITAYAEYNTKDSTAIPVVQVAMDYQALKGFFREYYADLKTSQLAASVSGGRTDKSIPVLKAKLHTQAADVRMGEQLLVKTGVLALEAASRYDAKGENVLLKWNPRLKVNLKNGELTLPERLPEMVKIPSIEFGYSNREMTIDNSRVELGHSDLNLKGNVRNIGPWLKHEAILEGELDVISDHCDANQLLSWFSADKGSEEQPGQEQSVKKEEVAKDSVKKEIEPFLVPTDVDLELKTHIREVEIFTQVAKDLKGGLYIRDGKMILDEMGFVCHAAKLQLTGLYRTPRRNHIYAGFDYHMIDVDVDELLSMIPKLEEMVPMLSSFKGAAQFHLAAETYLNSQYEPKMSTLRGAASLTGKNMVVMDGKTFSKISKLLLFKKKTKNVIDSINAELTVYKNEIDIYPLCVSMDNYMVALGGRHKTDMTFDYDINVLKPIYLGVHVGGDIDNLKIKLAKCKYAQDFRPHWYQKADKQSLELRRMIKNSMEKNVRIKSDQQ